MSEAIKAIKCELCGSNELVKQEDYFVCQFCGTKYTPEAAQKLIIDIISPVSINGVVEVTTGNAEKSKYLKNLNTLFQLKQWHELDDKLKIAIREYPDEWRVWFLRFKYIVLCQRDPMQRLDGSKVPYIRYYHLFEEEFDKAKQICPETEIISFEQCYSGFFNDLISEIENQNIVIQYRDAKCFSTISYRRLLYSYLRIWLIRLSRSMETSSIQGQSAFKDLVRQNFYKYILRNQSNACKMVWRNSMV